MPMLEMFYFAQTCILHWCLVLTRIQLSSSQVSGYNIFTVTELTLLKYQLCLANLVETDLGEKYEIQHNLSIFVNYIIDILLSVIWGPIGLFAQKCWS